MEFAGPAPMGPFAALAAEMPLRKPPEVRQVEPGQETGNSTTDTGQKPQQEATAAAARDIDALRREMERRDLQPGPPPTFQVSLLEVKQDFKEVIARIEAARTQARDADALKADAQAEERAAEAEKRVTAAEVAALETAGADPGGVSGPAAAQGFEVASQPAEATSAEPT